MIKHSDVIREMNMIAPPELAEEWDPIGLSIGSDADETTGIVLSLDLTDRAVALAEKTGANLIITHHPPIFSPLKQIHAEVAEQALMIRLIRAGITVFSAHTNLDAAEDGVGYRAAETVLATMACDRPYTVLIPPTRGFAAERYARGEKLGHGRFTLLDEAMPTDVFVERCRDAYRAPFVHALSDQNRPVRRVCFCPGSFDEAWIDTLVEKQIDTVVVGEIKHHVGVMLEMRDITAVVTGHDVNERVVLEPLAYKLKKIFANINIAVEPGIDYLKRSHS